MSSDDTTWSGLADLLFPPDIWVPIAEILLPGANLGILLAIGLAIIYVAALYIDKTKTITGAWNPWVIFWIVVVIIVIILIIGWLFSPISLFGYEILSAAPDTCTGDRPSLEAGMCYRNCRDGFHGSMSMCIADSVNRGAGVIPGLAHKDAAPNSWCPGGWHDDGALCRAPMETDWCGRRDLLGTCWPVTTGGQVEAKQATCPPPSDFGGDYLTEYWKWRESNSKGDPKPGETLVEANAAHDKTCADIAMVNDKHWDNKDGLCYKGCPADYPNPVPGMPYLCFKGGELSYDRGIGHAPHMFRAFRKYPVDVPPHLPVDNTPT